jgi:hypothetical protein
LIATVASPVAAAPVPSSTIALKYAATNPVSEVRWRRGGAVAAGVLGGLIIGSIIASAPYRYRGRVYYYAPGPVYAPGYYGYRDWLGYCFSRYRSFDPRSGTYLGYDGRRHYCR